MTPESQHTEWKRSWRDEHLKWICGFANAQGGILEIGRNDRGEIVGVKNVLRLLEDIPNKVQSLLGIVVDVDPLQEEDREYLRITVKPHANPISYKGDIHYRSGSTKQVLRGAALARVLLERQERNWGDAPVPGVRVADLNRNTLLGFKKEASENGRLNRGINDASDFEVIERLRLREGPYLTRAAILLFHPKPQTYFREAYLKIGYFRGAEILYQDLIQGDLFSQVSRAMDLIYSKYSHALISYRGIQRIETYPVPHEAMREALTNAVVHRDYAVRTPTQIRVYDNRITIWNSGRLPTGWSLDKLTGDHESHPYNPAIADTFFRAGQIEAWGRGIHRIRQVCQDIGSPTPEWHIGAGNGLRIEFPFSTTYKEAFARAHGRRTHAPQPTLDATQPNTQQTSRPTIHKTARQRILECLAAEPKLTRQQLAQRVGITPDGVKYHLAKLKAAGTLRRVGPSKGGHWKISDLAASGQTEP